MQPARRPPLLGLTEQQEAADGVAGPVRGPVFIQPGAQERDFPGPFHEGVGRQGQHGRAFLFAGQLKARFGEGRKGHAGHGLDGRLQDQRAAVVGDAAQEVKAAGGLSLPARGAHPKCSFISRFSTGRTWRARPGLAYPIHATGEVVSSGARSGFPSGASTTPPASCSSSAVQMS